jgi:hypothetical protein
MSGQPSRKFLEGDEEGLSNNSGGQSGCRIGSGGGGTNIPSQISAPRGLFDAPNWFPDFNTGNGNVQAFWKVPCIEGGARRPCFWIPITCMQFNQGSYSSWVDVLLDGFSATSIRRTMVILKNGDRSSPILQRYIKSGIGIRKMTIVFLRRIPCPDRTQEPQPFGDCEFQDESQVVDRGSCSRGPCCKDRNCYGRCDRCRRGGSRFSGDSVSDWEQQFPLRQETFIINLYCSRISGGVMVAGEKCRSKPTGCASGCSSFPGPQDPATWTGGPGLTAVGPEWQVIGQGPNFPDRPYHHGLGTVFQEQYQVMWGSATIEYERRNPLNGCRYFREKQTVPI